MERAIAVAVLRRQRCVAPLAENRCYPVRKGQDVRYFRDRLPFGCKKLLNVHSPI